MEDGAEVPCNFVNVQLELSHLRAAESCGHWISLKDGLNLSCHEGFEGRMAEGSDQSPSLRPRNGLLG